MFPKGSPESLDLIRQQKVNVLALRRLSVLNESGTSLPFIQFLKESKVIVVFIRHFGCASCRAHADQIWNLHRKVKKLKTRIVFIGNGESRHISNFKNEMKLDGAEVFTDPSLETFDACGMHRGVLNLVSVKSLSRLLQLKQDGYKQETFKRGSGVHRQMGGVVCFETPGKVTYHFTSEFLGDFDDPNEWPK